MREVAPSQPHHKTKWIWKLSAVRKVEAALALLMPFFGERRLARAQEALENCLEIGKPLPETCPKGHQDWAVWGGRRRCRVCNSEWTKNWTERQHG